MFPVQKKRLGFFFVLKVLSKNFVRKQEQHVRNLVATRATHRKIAQVERF